MEGPMYADTAMVELQGGQALKLLAVDYEHAQYQLTGFAELKIIVTDHREEGLRAIHAALATRNRRGFAEHFSAPAYVVITPADQGLLTIDLYDTKDISPANVLWLAVGIPGGLPIYDYLFYHYEVRKEEYSLLAVYQMQPVLFSAFSPAFSFAPAFGD